ncbi:class I fructose-bisphosphate aldolase [Mucilaginibacter aquaedulcis]|uniref:class I fructose-bisphosphate aldolase n=1 Tax=Mucilaginibacter aquaedulcis TaxID=1187081 RepID=UPI0025B395BF|nr:class I fructose-bisphosphate aldolase [Mucilaginibacter aquaedulcis]MDN3546976.1 fructose-bisphosphate aldolase class I [Mucilaginibacter aquaedulcis]
MDKQSLRNIAQRLMDGDKGLLAMDESIATCNKRFAEAGIPQTEEYRRKYREMIVTTPDLGECISGAILFDETTKQAADDGTPFIDLLVKGGIIPGIKLDEGAKSQPAFPGEKVTEGLDGLRERLKVYAVQGLKFAKWRAVITIAEDTPTDGSIYANAHALARYAALCQEAGLVPIVEPEVLMDGSHTIERCFEVTERVLHIVFEVLIQQRIYLEGMILKPNMVVSGLLAPVQADAEEVADATVQCLLRCVPAAVPGVAFLSGGQAAQDASAHLNAMHIKYKDKLPWALTFSFARAVQQPAMEYWAGKEENVAVAQQLLYKRASINNAARRGEYTPAIEA